MATAYTSLLGLALPVTGELAGTWGDTVNNSITSLLDSAVSGTTTLSTDADVTLTTTTGAANQARQAILLCSGARTVLRNITAPAQSKLYVVINSTTGGFGVVIRGVGPTTGVTVANGKTAVVVWNGTDFVEVAPAVATNLSGGAAGSLPYQTAASTTTFLGIGAANYVLTSTGTAPTWTINTGTGSVVRATSPTITTPTITTSATVPLLIGGTATTSTLTLRSTSGVGTTGADIIFQTGNNGATEAMRVLNNGNIAITATADSIGGAYRTVTLNASGGSGFILQTAGVSTGYVYADTALNLSTGASGTAPIVFRTNSNERMRITSAGALLVGATAQVVSETASITGATNTSSSGAYPCLITAVDTRAYNSTAPSPGGGITFGYKYNVGGSITLGPSIQGFKENTTDGDFAGALKFLTRINGASPAEVMRITSAGNVGIGTITPGSPLTVYAGNNQATIKVTNGPSANNVGITLESLGGNVVLNNGNGPFELTVGGAIRAVVTAAGDMGVGTTTPGSWGKLAATGSVASVSPDTSSVVTLNAATGGVGTLTSYNATGAYLALFTANTSGVNTERMRITSAGNVGVGTAAPAQLLHIASGDATALIENTAATSNATLQLKYPSRTWALANRGADLSGAFAIRDVTAGADRLIITSAGLVAINTTSPLANNRLHVEQNANANYSTSFAPGTTPSQLVLRDISDVATYTNPFAAVQFGAGSTGAGFSYIAGAREGSGTSFLAFGTGTGGQATERMRITSAGFVGIGTNAPASKLHVYGAGNYTLYKQETTGTATTEASWVNPSGNTVIGTDGVAGYGYAGTFVSKEFRLYTNSAERMRLLSGGQLLLGTTTSSGLAQNYIDINAASNCGINFKATDVTQGYVYADDVSNEFRLAATGGSNQNALTLYTATLERMRITSAGVVNIPNLTASQAVFTDASKNLVSNAITGSGSVVMSTSPTLVTPILGTPTSGNFSTGTFTWPTFNQNTTGTAAGLSATLVATSGGTGQSSYAIGDLLYASTTTALSKLADVATGNALISGGVGVAPSYGKVGLTTHVSGTLPVANGGTGITSLGTGVATWLETPSSANLLAAMTDETGTGALVFATSPTLVTPNIGAATGTSLAATGGTVLVRAAATQDGVQLQGRAGGTGSWEVAITPTTLTADRTVTLADGNTTLQAGTMAVTGTGLNQFAATTSAQLAGVISDETGTGSLVFGTSPTFTTSATAPLVIGGTTTTSPLALRSTSGVGATGADIIFQVGNNGATEAMRVLNSGSVGIGTATPGAFKLNVAGAGVNIGATGTGNPSLQAVSSDAAGISYLALQNGTRNWSIRDEGTSGALSFRDDTAVAERMRIDTAGNVGIGTNAPGYPLHLVRTQVGSVVYGTAGNTDTTSGSGSGWAAVHSSVSIVLNARSDLSLGLVGTFSNHPVAFYTNTTERMRIDTAGNVLFDKTAANLGSTGIELKPGGFAQFTGNLATTNELVNFNNINAGNIAYDIAFRQQGTIVGSIRTNSASVTYNTSSDYRLKENVLPITGALAKVAALKPVSYTWKVDGSDGEGFIAHELQEVCPLAVTGEKDAVGEDGKPVHQGIDPSKIIGLLTAAIQEQQATITALTTRIAALEAK